MYIPPHFAETDRKKLREFIERYGFAILMSQNGGHPVASHLPLLCDDAAGTPDRLLGHMARANDQWKSAAGQRVLAIFHGPHAYISPTWYAATNVVPTWNYVAVHVTGTLRLVEDRDRLRDIVRRLVTKYEAAQPLPWSMDSQDEDFLDRMLNAIVGFEIEVVQIEGKWKLNQNHDAGRRERVVKALRETGISGNAEIADLM